jgi:hypothetical protein
MAAVVCLRYNPDIQAQCQRLMENGKSKIQALGAGMRKLVQICFGVVKHQSEYHPQVVLHNPLRMVRRDDIYILHDVIGVGVLL